VNCWHCDTELIWGGDHDISEEDENCAMVTNLHCPNCQSTVDVYLPKEGGGFLQGTMASFCQA